MSSNDLDVIVPYHGPADRLLAQLDSIQEFTKVNHRLVIVLDACGSGEVAAARAWLQEKRPEKSTILATTDMRSGLTRSLQMAFRARDKAPREYAAVLHPGVELNDHAWLDKMTTAFKDVSCFITYAELFSTNSHGLPRIVDRTMHPAEGVIMLRRATANDIVDTDINHPWMHTASKARKDGRRVYAVPSVKLRIAKLVDSNLKVLKGSPSMKTMVER